MNPRHLILVLTVVFLIGCKLVEEDITIKEQAHDLLNRREYEEAITLLKQFLQENPHDNEAKLMLGSAYSGSVGLTVIDLFPAIDFAMKQSQVEQLNLTQDNPSPDPGSQSVNGNVQTGSDQGTARLNLLLVELESGLIDYANKAAVASKVFFNIPHLNDQARARLVEAVLLASEVPAGSEFYPRAVGFSVIVDFAQFVNYLKDAFPHIQKKENLRTDAIVCSINSNNILSAIPSAVKFLDRGLYNFITLSEAMKKPPSKAVAEFQVKTSELKTILSRYKGDAAAAAIAVTTIKNRVCRNVF